IRRLSLPALLASSLLRLPPTSTLFPYTTLFRSMPFTSATYEALCQMANEAISNVVRHAHASKIRISASHNDRLFRLSIVDDGERSEEHTSELQSRENLVCRLLLEKKKDTTVHRW